MSGRALFLAAVGRRSLIFVTIRLFKFRFGDRSALRFVLHGCAPPP